LKKRLRLKAKGCTTSFLEQREYFIFFKRLPEKVSF
jgi:hypothetical protein